MLFHALVLRSVVWHSGRMDIELFLADLEGRFAEQRRRDNDLLVEELTDAERAGVTLAARLLAVDGPVALVLRGGRRLDGAVRDCTRTWVLVRGDGGDSLVPLGAVVGAWPLGRVAAGEAGVKRGAGMGHVLREFAARGVPLVVDHDAGAHRGRIVAVYADHVDVEAGEGPVGDSRDWGAGARVSLALSGLRELRVADGRW